MNKLIIKVVFMVVFMVGLTSYMTYVQTGKSPFDFSNMSAPDISLNADSIKGLLPSGGGAESGKDVFYKWVDDDGLTQYTQVPPPEHIKAEVIALDPNMNVIQGVKPKARVETAKKKRQIGQMDGSVYSPGNMKRLMDDAKNVEKVLNDRAEQQKQMLDGL
ncbi:MAG: hypothetical protein COA42_21605 [Alteromonadaceae bacterium]|nr:MAG: hypothetical protein COA42_21605 [Alteromonadaceae bacterium]